MVSLNGCLYLRRRGEKYYADRKRKADRYVQGDGPN